MSPKRAIVHIPLADTLSDTQLENVCEVILHNDDHNAMEHVVTSLMRVFRHSQALAVKIKANSIRPRSSRFARGSRRTLR